MSAYRPIRAPAFGPSNDGAGLLPAAPQTVDQPGAQPTFSQVNNYLGLVGAPGNAGALSGPAKLGPAAAPRVVLGFNPNGTPIYGPPGQVVANGQGGFTTPTQTSTSVLPVSGLVQNANNTFAAAQPAPTPGTTGASGVSTTAASGIPTVQQLGQEQADNLFTDVNAFAQSQQAGQRTFAQQEQAAQGQTASEAGLAARQAGVGAGAGIAAQAATNLAAGERQQQGLFDQKSQNALNDFVNQELKTNLGDTASLQGLTADKQLAVQSAAKDTVVAEISKALQSSQNVAQGDAQNLSNLIASYQTGQLSDQQKHDQFVKILTIGLGLLEAGGAVAAGATGVGAPVAIGLGVASAGTLLKGASM